MKLLVKYGFFFASFLLISTLSAQSSKIIHTLGKVQNTTRVLYIAAHPDDENTRLISYLSNSVGAETAYLSLTRGDGGQNLIGDELSEKLGVLRTQELMQARTIDGGKQFFTRAVDFGYSKTADETFEKWNKAEVLSDVVYVIRKFQPHVIITRFPPDARAGHGHHTASAILTKEAFELANDESYKTEQLSADVKVWQPSRLYWNTSTWWGLPLDSLYKNTNDYIRVDVGGYDANLGQSYNELASLSRTQHKSQGFGVSIARGLENEYLMYVAGSKATGSIFEGLPKTWADFGAKEIDKKLLAIKKIFKPNAPQNSLKMLFELRTLGDKIMEDRARKYFFEEVNKLILLASGIRVEALGEKEYVSPGDSLKLSLEVIDRLGLNATFNAAFVLAKKLLVSLEYGDSLNNNLLKKEAKILIPQGLSSQPYWLVNEYENLFTVAGKGNLAKPENDPVLSALFSITIMQQTFEITVPVRYKYSDRVEGEIERPVAILPAVLGSVAEDNLIFTSKIKKPLILNVENTANAEVTVKAEAQGFIIEPQTFIIAAGGKKTVTLNITPLDSNAVAYLNITYGNGEQLMSLTELAYPHIDKRIVLNPTKPKLVSMPLLKKGALVGYIPGAGDKVADAIRQMGYEVDILDENDIRTFELKNYRAIITGIRAYNTEVWLANVKSILMEYVNNGGTFVVQYNTRSRDLTSTDIGPYPFQLSRDRVTEENAEVKFTAPEHPVLNKPNKITQKDFDVWVQERGLYFAGEWDAAYKTPLAWHDASEEDLLGGLIVADYGKGAFIYTGISFFRELPAGVPGAYRLLANLLSYKPKP